jgi:hypothetical protein
MRVGPLLLAIIVAAPAFAQQKPSALAQCRADLVQTRADNDALRADLARLRKELDDLRKTASAKTTTPAEAPTAKATETADAPVRDAMAALRAVESVILTGTYVDFKKVFLDAKVKVDALPAGEKTERLHEVLDVYADAESVWSSYMANRQILYRSALEKILPRNPGLQSAARAQFTTSEYTNYYLDSVMDFLAASAKAKLAAIS